MKDKIVKFLSTCWMLALIIFFACVGWLVMTWNTDPGLAGVAVFVSAIYISYTMYWSSQQGKDGID